MGELRARARRAVVTALVVAAGAAAGVLRLVRPGRRLERTLLQRVWSTGSTEMLDAYLVSGYQNPYLNVQSILVRHALAADLIPDDRSALMDAEIGFAVELNETIRRRADELGVTMGAYRDPEKLAAVRRVDAAVSDRQREYVERWRALLETRGGPRIEVLELACGSANDYRAFDACGMGPHLAYVGVDLSPKNIANARRRHPDVTFQVADILDLPFDDQAFDHVIASDVFEHLSAEALDRALLEAARRARRAMILTFFNMADIPEHQVQRRRVYHWNRLSRRRIAERLRSLGFPVIVQIPIARWLDDRYGYGDSYNRDAWTVIAERVPDLTTKLPHRWDAPAETG